jgi:hypothetical protein
MKLEDLKQAVAAVKSVEDLPVVMANVASFVDIIAKASEEQAVARAAAEQNAKTIEAKLAEVTKAAEANVAEVSAKLNAITKAHEELLAAHQAAAAEQAFQTRMASVEEIFAFDDAARADVVEEIKACSDDAAFTKWMARAQRMYKGFAKANVANTAKASDDKDEDDKNGDMDKEESCAAKKKKEDEACATAAKTALASASNAVVDPAINNIIDASANTESLFERLKKIAAKNTRIGGETVEALTAKANAVKQTS